MSSEAPFATKLVESPDVVRRPGERTRPVTSAFLHANGPGLKPATRGASLVVLTERPARETKRRRTGRVALRMLANSHTDRPHAKHPRHLHELMQTFGAVGSQSGRARALVAQSLVYGGANIGVLRQNLSRQSSG